MNHNDGKKGKKTQIKAYSIPRKQIQFRSTETAASGGKREVSKKGFLRFHGIYLTLCAFIIWGCEHRPINTILIC